MTDTAPPYFQQDGQTSYTDPHTPLTSLPGSRGEADDNPIDPRDPSLQEDSKQEDKPSEQQ